VRTLIREYNAAVTDLTAFNAKAHVEEIDEKEELSIEALLDMAFDAVIFERKPVNRLNILRSVLLKITIRCDEALGALEAVMRPKLPPDTVNALRGLRDELNKLLSEGLDENIYRTILIAIAECEEGHYDASATIASRPITYIKEQICGSAPIGEMVKILVSKGLIPKDREDEQKLIEAVKKARDFLAHRVNVYAKPEDPLILIGVAVKLARIYMRWLKIVGN